MEPLALPTPSVYVRRDGGVLQHFSQPKEANLSYRYLIMGTTRTGTARALCEYRNFIRNNPESDLAPCLASTMQRMRLALREQREIERAIGWGRKPLADNE